MKTMRTMAALGLAAAVLAWGCDTKTDKKVEQHVSEEHEHHDPGPHKGAVEDFGAGGKYQHHVEVVHDRDKKEVTIYVLGPDEKTARPIKADKLTLTQGDVQVELMPQDKDKDGASSRFVGKAGKLGDEGPVAPYEVTGVIGGKQYAAKYKKEKKEA